MNIRVKLNGLYILGLLILICVDLNGKPLLINKSDSAHVYTAKDPAFTGRNKDSIPILAASENQAFMKTWQSFEDNIRRNDLQGLKAIVAFPLMGAGACYLRQYQSASAGEDTAGIEEPQFDSLFTQIFDAATRNSITSPMTENDSIIIWHDSSAINRVIQDKMDPGTNIYGYHIEYVRDNREGGVYFIFGRFDGAYKLAAILCDGLKAN